jgi:hypothetical protein
MTQSPEWVDQSPEVVHLVPPQGGGKTPCCEKSPFELPQNHRMTEDESIVTCPGVEEGAPALNVIVMRRAALGGRADGSLGRLLAVRAALEGASPSAIDDKLRGKLMDLIDRGYTHA